MGKVFEAEEVHWRERSLRMSGNLAWYRTIASSDLITSVPVTFKSIIEAVVFLLSQGKASFNSTPCTRSPKVPHSSRQQGLRSFSSSAPNHTSSYHVAQSAARIMSVAAQSNEIAEDYKNSLEDLTANSRWEISNLTVIAKENTEHAFAISRVLENHIKNVSRDKYIWCMMKR